MSQVCSVVLRNCSIPVLQNFQELSAKGSSHNLLMLHQPSQWSAMKVKSVERDESLLKSDPLPGFAFAALVVHQAMALLRIVISNDGIVPLPALTGPEPPADACNTYESYA